jgi:hypothetical protein
MVPVKIEIPIPFFLTELDKSKIQSHSSSSVKKHGWEFQALPVTFFLILVKKYIYQNSCSTNGTGQ